MDFKQYVDTDLKNRYKAILTDKAASPYAENVRVSDYSIFKDKYRQYKKRLEDEKYGFNQAIDKANQNKLAREQAEQERARQVQIRKEEKKKKRKAIRKRIVSGFICLICVCILILMIPNSRFWVAERLMDIKQYAIAVLLFETLDDYDESDAYQMKIYYADALSLIYEGKEEDARGLLQDKDSWLSVVKADDLDGQSIIDYATSQHSGDDSISYVYDKEKNPKLSYSWDMFTKKTNPYDFYSSEKTYVSSIFIEYIYDNAGVCTEIIVISRTKYQFG